MPIFETQKKFALAGGVAFLVKISCRDHEKPRYKGCFVAHMTMSPLNARDSLQEILVECGYFHWYVLEPDDLDPTSCETKCILFNIKARRKAEVAIPNEWLNDPRRFNAIAELITVAIENGGAPIPDNVLLFLPPSKLRRV